MTATWKCVSCGKSCEAIQDAGKPLLLFSSCCWAMAYRTDSCPRKWPATIDASDLLVWQLVAAINGQPVEDCNVLIDLKDQIQRARK